MQTQANQQLYDFNVRLAGNVMHDVPKSGCTILEMKLLRALHGEDAVTNLRKARGGKEAPPEREEVRRLAEVYGKTVVEDLLHVQLDDFDEWMAEQSKEADDDPVDVAEILEASKPDPNAKLRNRGEMNLD